VDMDALRLFVDLAETGSFSKTAGKHFVSQSAVSQRVRSLEKELGHRLVERGKGRPGTHFTEAGERTLTYAREILGRADALKRELTDLGSEIGGALNVATVYSIGLHALTPAVSSYLRQFPTVNLHLEYLRTDRIYEALLAGTIDCGIVACPRERAGIAVRPLECEHMVVALPAGHPLAECSTIEVSALQNLPFVAFDTDIPTRVLIDGYLAEHGVSVRITQAFDNIETIKRVVEIGLGVSILPEPTVEREARDGTIVVRPLQGAALTRPTGVLLPRGRTPSRALERFLAVLAPDQT
jgi:LysR family transcriptional regulator, transcriptional activator of the cysJI operon